MSSRPTQEPTLDISREKSDELKSFLRTAFPEAVAEEKIDYDQLRRVLGDTVEPDRERFGLNWPGRADCMKVIQAPSRGALKPQLEKSVNWDDTANLVIDGDNLEVLKLLQKAYFGRVKLIYIDPPYNTGGEFIYPDKYAENLETYLQYTGQSDAGGRKFSTNSDTSGRYHSRWLNMMYPRLYLAKNLLADDGSIFVSIDAHEVHHLRCVLDQIFGEENYRTTISWQKRYTRSNNTVDFTEVVEYILVYSRSPSFSVNLLPRTEDADARYTNPDNDERGVWKGASFLNPATPQERPNLAYPIKNPNTGQVTLPTRSAWRRSKEAFEQLGAEGKLYWGPDGTAAVPSIKMFLSEARGLTPTNFWEHEYAGHTDEGTRDLDKLLPGRVFNNPKPVKLIQRIIEHVCDSDSLILDFFAGSGVTAEAVIRSNVESQSRRKFILVQLPEPCEDKAQASKRGFETITDITRARVRAVIDELAGRTDTASIDLGYRGFRLDRSNFKEWGGVDASLDDIDQRLDLHADHLDPLSTEEDILFELLLKDGFPPSAQVEVLTLASKRVFAVANRTLLVCLDRALTQSVLDAMADLEPSRVTCLDAGFQGNDQLKANAVQTFRARARSRETAIEFRTV
ncbi:MAG: site-specific DNA-methyltransferase [Alphaproteobacteria bacterium]|nr:site-specific DNA-methyltransferase [Alphaproteobacteria bacterium]